MKYTHQWKTMFVVTIKTPYYALFIREIILKDEPLEWEGNPV